MAILLLGRFFKDFLPMYIPLKLALSAVRQVGQVFARWRHNSMQSLWKVWPHGSVAFEFVEESSNSLRVSTHAHAINQGKVGWAWIGLDWVGLGTVRQVE